MTITHIVFDMGGVLVELQWLDRVKNLLDSPMTLEELHKLWVGALSTADFETGRSDFDAFTAAFIQEFELAIAPDRLQHEFLEIVQAPLPQCNEMLSILKPRYHLSLLSNTNPAHYMRLRDRYDFFDYFDQLFLSYQIGVMKPSPAIFEHLLTTLNTPADTVAFFDDGIRNVEAACALGIHAYRVDSPTAAMAVVEGFS
ncbi:HAD family phosphatase [Nodosilinea sp. LEGE 07298]|uniref:HAD family hydrolase n=1 Tax=Nodosilinea sp. LEGE 07298 TaxID=2777970 RepID=UPI0018820637|nr:HAD family phosphatase [Nodosilinea sp. LEGE 07298]MBE9112633.1 HAD family phosphatase [Nodosilinea sp. LEGE 07298]